MPNETFHDRGLPYHFRGPLSMSPQTTLADGGLSTLTIDPGVIMKFERVASSFLELRLGTANGPDLENIWGTRLIALGTSENPIILTSAEEQPASGDWVGLKYSGSPSSGSVVENVRIEYAGSRSGTQSFGCGPTNNDAAIIITNWRPDDAFIRESTIIHSAGGGIVSGWRSDLDGPNLRAGNTFIDVAGVCEVSRWANESSACPSNGNAPDCI